MSRYTVITNTKKDVRVLCREKKLNQNFEIIVLEYVRRLWLNLANLSIALDLKSNTPIVMISTFITKVRDKTSNAEGVNIIVFGMSMNHFYVTNSQQPMLNDTNVSSMKSKKPQQPMMRSLGCIFSSRLMRPHRDTLSAQTALDVPSVMVIMDLPYHILIQRMMLPLHQKQAKQDVPRHEQ